MKRITIVSVLFFLLGGTTFAQDEPTLRDKWLDIGVGFQGIRYQSFDNLTEFSSIEERPFARLGYRHWLMKKFGVGFDVSYGKLYARSSALVFRQMVLDASFLLHYKLFERSKFSVFGSAGFSLLDFEPDSGNEEILENASRASLPLQLNSTYQMTEKMHLIFQAAYKKPISDLPDYFQVSLGVSFNLNKGKATKKATASDIARVERNKLKQNALVEPRAIEEKASNRNHEVVVGTNSTIVTNDLNSSKSSVKDLTYSSSFNVEKKRSNQSLDQDEDKNGTKSVGQAKLDVNRIVGEYEKIKDVELMDKRKVNGSNNPIFRNLKGQTRISIEDIELNSDYELDGESTLEFLDQIALLLIENKTAHLSIYSHANKGEDTGSSPRSRTRVNAVKQYLINKGISDDRLNTKALTFSLKNTTNKESNNRVDLEIIFK